MASGLLTLNRAHNHLHHLEGGTTVNPRLKILGLLCVAMLALSMARPAKCSAPAPKPQQWEYLILGDLRNMFGESIGTTAQGLANAGAEGWEAVAIYPNATTLMKRPRN